MRVGLLGSMLFDEEADPHEMKNLAGDPKFAKVKGELAELAERFRSGKAR